MIVKSKRMFVMDRGSVEKSRQRRSLPSPKRLRAGRSPISSAHVLSEIRVKSVFVSYIMHYIPNFRCKTSQRTISLKVRSVLKNYLSPTGKYGHMNSGFTNLALDVAKPQNRICSQTLPTDSRRLTKGEVSFLYKTPLAL